MNTTTARRRLKLGLDVNNFGSRNAVTGNPDISAVAWKYVEGGGLYVPFGAPKIKDVPHDRDGFGFHPPEPDTWIESGVEVQSNPGELPIQMILRGVGDPATPSPDDRVLDMILRSGLGVIPAPSEGGGAGPNDTVDTAGGPNQFTGSNGAIFAPGGLFMWDGDASVGRQAAQVLTADGVSHIVKHSPSFSRDLAPADVVRMMRTYVAGDNLTLGSSLACQLDAPGFRQNGVGGRLRQLVLEHSSGEERKMMIAANILFAHTWNDHNNADPSGVVTPDSGKRMRRIRCRTTFSTTPVGEGVNAANGVVAGTGMPGTPLQIRRFKATLTNTLEPRWSDNVLGMDDMDVTGCDLEVEIETSRPVTTHDLDLWRRYSREFMQTFGPMGNGQGGAFHAGALFLDPASDPANTGRQLPDKAAQFTQFKFKAGTPRLLPPPAGASELARQICAFAVGI